jgi:tyrosinase
MHSYEKALRDECGYTGGQPYWDWSANEADPASNALFTEPGGIGSNGVVEDHVALQFLLPTYPPKSGLIPPGTGGGCVVDGPFANMIQNLGPYGP